MSGEAPTGDLVKKTINRASFFPSGLGTSDHLRGAALKAALQDQQHHTPDDRTLVHGISSTASEPKIHHAPVRIGPFARHLHQGGQRRVEEPEHSRVARLHRGEHLLVSEQK